MSERQVTMWACPSCGDPEDGSGRHTTGHCIVKLKADMEHWKECYAVVCRQLEYRNTELVQRLRELADVKTESRADIDKTNDICLEVMRERDEARGQLESLRTPADAVPEGQWHEVNEKLYRRGGESCAQHAARLLRGRFQLYRMRDKAIQQCDEARTLAQDIVDAFETHNWRKLERIRDENPWLHWRETEDK